MEDNNRVKTGCSSHLEQACDRNAYSVDILEMTSLWII